MQKGTSDADSAGGTVFQSDISRHIEHDMLAEIQAIVSSHGKNRSILDNAINDALREAGAKVDTIAPTDIRSSFVGIVMWKIFGGDDTLWINLKTDNGNQVPLDLLAIAYAIWEDALKITAKYALDTLTTAESLAKATHITADQLADKDLETRTEQIRNPRKYLISVFMHLISDVVESYDARKIEIVDMEAWITRRELSDRGAYQESLDAGIFCREILKAMPPQGRSVAVSRLIYGYSWQETARRLNTSVNAVQKALSDGIRRTLGLCKQELRKNRNGQLEGIKTALRNRKKLISKIKTRDGYED